VIYAKNSPYERQAMLDVLPTLNPQNLPWIALGDWNCMLAPNERFRGMPLTPKDIPPLNEAIMKDGLIECKASRLFYTWNNKSRHGDQTFSKLDRVFLN